MNEVTAFIDNCNDNCPSVATGLRFCGSGNIFGIAERE